MSDGQFNCPYCGRPVSRPTDAADTTLCPGCQIPIPVPDRRDSDHTPVSGEADSVFPPRSMPPPPGQAQSPGSVSELEAMYKLRMVGIFNIVAGGISLLVTLIAGLAALTIMALPSEELQRQLSASGTPIPPAFIIYVYAIPALLSLPAGIIQISGGVALLRRSISAWKLGYASAIVSLISLWLSCGFILTLACGIYTLIVLNDQQVKALLTRKA